MGEDHKHLASIIEGVDPLERRRRAVKGDTIGDLSLVYLQNHAKPHKKTWKDDERRIRKYILPIWKNLSVSNIGRADVVALHSKIGHAIPTKLIA